VKSSITTARRSDRTLTVTDGRFTLDGAKDKAIYYEVVFR